MSGQVVELNSGVYGVGVDFEPQPEPWVRYKLLDGGEVRLKATVRKIYQMVDKDGNPNRDSHGLPTYGAEHKSDIIFKGQEENQVCSLSQRWEPSRWRSHTSPRRFHL